MVAIIPKLCARLCTVLTGVTALKWACHVFSLPREMTPHPPVVSVIHC